MPTVSLTSLVTAARVRTDRRAAGAAGAVATAAAGVLAIATMAPQVTAAGPVLSSQVQLLSTSDSLLPVIESLLAEQQQMQAEMTQYPFISPVDLSMTHEYAQNVLQTMMAAQTVAFNYHDLNNVAMPFAPYGWDAPGANNQNLLVYQNPDDQYTSLPLSPSHTYTMTIDPPAGPNGTGDVSFTFLAGNGVTTPFVNSATGDHSLGSVELSQFTPNANGSYTITFSPTSHSGNWIEIPADSERTIVRDSVVNWGLPHDSFSISEQGVPSPSPTHPPLLTDQQIASILDPVAANGAQEAGSPDYLGQLTATNAPAPNTLTDIQPTDTFMPGPLLTGNNQWLSAGDYSLQPDQALIVKVPTIDASYSSAMVTNMYGQTAPSATATGNLNFADTFHDPNGYTYYVISSQNPGVANWLNDNGAADGGIWLRFQGLATVPKAPIPVTTEVVDVADVKQYLPADTPTVTPAEYAADAQLRLFEWDYTHDQNENIAWLGANLEYDQIKAAVGPQMFAEIFGGQSTQYGLPQDVPSVFDRMLNPALIPNPLTLVKDTVANPVGSLIALKDNLSIAVNDVTMPTLLSLLRSEVVVEQTVHAMHSAISSGQWSQVLTDLVTGLGGFGTVVDETLTDPATSITAGLLNARDDLAVSIMNAGSYSASSSGSASFVDSLSQLAQSVAQALNPTTALDDFSTLSTEISSQIASQGADVAPVASAVPFDLLP